MPNAALEKNVDMDDSIAPTKGVPAVESNDQLITSGPTSNTITTTTSAHIREGEGDTINTTTSTITDMCERRKLLMRLAIRTGIYILYDSVPAATKESSRVAKVLLEACADEYYALGSGGKAPYWEYLLPPTLSSIFWTVLLSRRRISTKPSISALKLVFVPVHRCARHLLIHRLFTRFGTTNYTLLSLLGVVCCFFREDLFSSFFDLASWPAHFSPRQGIIALARSLLYSATFSIPLQPYIESRRQRGAAKKLIFSLTLSQIANIQRLFKALAAAQ